MDIGRIGLWQGVLDQRPSSEVREIVAELEEMGWPTVWIPEAVGRDPFVSASVMLDATTTLKIATGIVQIHARHPHDHRGRPEDGGRGIRQTASCWASA